MNRVRKIILVGLILAGLGVWSYNGLLLVARLGSAAPSLSPEERGPGRASLDLTALTDTVRAAYDGAFRDPFEPDLRLPPPSTPKPAPMRPSTPDPPPSLTLQGILWDQTDPIATIKGPDGRSENLRMGMSLAGATVVRIGPASVVLRVGTQMLTLVSSGPRL